MKTTYHIPSFLVASLSLLCACTSSLDEVIDLPNDVPFALSVSVDNCTPTGGGAATRAGDAYPVTFANGDRLGLIAIDGNSNNIVANYNNVPFVYKDGKWSPATALPFSAAHKYLVYYPYQEAMTGKATKEEIIASFSPLADQRSEAAYRQSDLLVCDLITPQATDKTLNVVFKHAFSLLVIPAVKATISSEGYEYQCGLQFIDPGITVGTEVYFPYLASDGTARLVVKPRSNLSLKAYYRYDGEMYSSSANSVTLSESYYYVFKELVVTEINYGFDKVQVGDFYCSNGSGNGYLIPYNAVSLPDDTNCIGIVYWLGDPTDTTNGDPLLKTQHSGCTHGLVVALHDAGNNSLWSSSYEDITGNWLQNQTTYGITSLKVTDKMQGYANTQALIGYNASDRVTGKNSNKKVLPIEAITTYASAHPTPASSSGWYFPSVMELKYMCWGQRNSGGTAGRNVLNTQLGKVPGASSLQSGNYWSSAEYDYSWARGVGFDYGSVGSYGKDSNSYGVRAVAAF